MLSRHCQCLTLKNDLTENTKLWPHPVLTKNTAAIWPSACPWGQETGPLDPESSALIIKLARYSRSYKSSIEFSKSYKKGMNTDLPDPVWPALLHQRSLEA